MTEPTHRPKVAADSEADATISTLGHLLVTLGFLGLAFTVWLALMLIMFSHASAPGFNDYFVIALVGIPYLMYIVSVRRKWRHSKLMSVGLISHLAWLPILVVVSEILALFIGAIVVAAGSVTLFMKYAQRMRSSKIE